MKQNHNKTIGTIFEYIRGMYNKKIKNISNKKSFVDEMAWVNKRNLFLSKSDCGRFIHLIPFVGLNCAAIFLNFYCNYIIFCNIIELQFNWKNSNYNKKFSNKQLEKFHFKFSETVNTKQNQIKINGMILAIYIVMDKFSKNIKKSFSYSKELLKSLATKINLGKYFHQIQDCDVLFIHLIPIKELNCIAIFLNINGFSILLNNFQFYAFSIINKFMPETFSRNNNQMYFTIWLFSESDCNNFSIVGRAIILYSQKHLGEGAFSKPLNF